MKQAQRRGRIWSIALLMFGAASPLAAQVADATPEIARHPLETRALVDPHGVLAELPERIREARTAGNSAELALLHLAEANACRVIADLPCQRDAGARAYEDATHAGDPQLQARALIAESRGRIAMQDYSTGETRLGEAERILELHPSPSLAGDVQLAYSSLSYALGKNALARDYAKKGLELIGTLDVPPIRVRLLRNQARAMAQLGDRTGAETVLRAALKEVARIDDPKLEAELHLEIARIARIDGDTALQERSAQEILSLSQQLENSQLTGLAHEVLGLSALDTGHMDVAEDELRRALASFAGLKLERDERRVLRALLKSLFGRTTPASDLEPLMGRLVELESGLDASDRALASDDFEARLRYAQQEFDVKSLEASVELARERQVAFDAQRRLAYVVAISGGLLVAVLLLSVRTLRHANTRLKQTQAELHRLARVDSLSGVANRRCFEERLAASIAHCRRENEAIALLVLDLDNFKAINDQHGHPAGDATIVEFSRRVRACLRENDLVARLGGDEFAVLMDNPTLEGAQTVAGKILVAMQEPMILGDAAVQVATSIGLTFSASPGHAETLLQLADEALYAAKDAGRATFRTRVDAPVHDNAPGQ